jgi:hypothetical protein
MVSAPGLKLGVSALLDRRRKKTAERCENDEIIKM